MSFSEFDTQMRKYEESYDQYITPGMYYAVRLDGKGFSKFTKNCGFKKPFDEEFRDLMLHTTKTLINAGFRVIYGYTQSDEISLLIDKDDDTYSRKTRKINSILAGEASVAFSMASGERAIFDCRVIPLPGIEAIQDYFVWREDDACRNALNGYCYWTLRQREGMSKRKATAALENKGNSFKNELLFEHGINFNKVPAWQRRGSGIYTRSIEIMGYNPITKREVPAKRNKVFIDLDLPQGAEYKEFIEERIIVRASKNIPSSTRRVSGGMNC